MTTIAIITAMESELNAVLKLYDFVFEKNCYKAQLNGVTLLLKLSGIGKVNAALACAQLIDAGADLVISTGLAGGIDNRLEQGDVVLSNRVCYYDVDCGEPSLIGQVQGLPLYYEVRTDFLNKIGQHLKGYFFEGLIVTGDKFLTDVHKLNEIKKLFPDAMAVDMESAAIAQTCYLKSCPYLSLRIISDVVGKNKQVEEYNRFWENVPNKASEMVRLVLEALLF